MTTSIAHFFRIILDDGTLYRYNVHSGCVQLCRRPFSKKFFFVGFEPPTSSFLCQHTTTTAPHSLYGVTPGITCVQRLCLKHHNSAPVQVRRWKRVDPFPSLIEYGTLRTPVYINGQTTYHHHQDSFPRCPRFGPHTSSPENKTQ